MTRLTDNHLGTQQNLPQQQQPASTHQRTPQLTRIEQELQPTLQPTLPTSRPTPETAPNDRLAHDRPMQSEAPGAVAAGLPVGGEPVTGHTEHEVNPQARLGEAWATVFGHAREEQATNMLMNKVKVLQATKNDVGRAEERLGNSSATVGARRTLPSGSLTVNGDGSVTTPGGFTVLNDGGFNWRIREPSGQEHRVWGDPHVDENNDGQNDWHFNRDASFILPDGTKIFCDTSKVGSYGGADVTLSDQLKIQYGESLAAMDVRNGGGAALTADGNYDLAHGDGQIFVLADDHRFLDGRSLGDVYDRGGDFIADINRGQRGSISEHALITLSGSHEVSRHASIMQDRERAQNLEMQHTPTLSQMVTNVLDEARVTKRGEAEDKAAGETLGRPIRQINTVNR